jgi:hypothetical protein
MSSRPVWLHKRNHVSKKEKKKPQKQKTKLIEFYKGETNIETGQEKRNL